MNKTNGVWGVVAGAALLTMAGCQCTQPVGERVEETQVDMSKSACPPVQAACPSTLTTVIRRNGEAGPALPPVGEITVIRNNCQRAKMVFVAVRPDDRCYNMESRSFERPWPWGPYGMGNCCP
ncbi:MAG: hypothetical protein PHQ12_12400 [Chthoniobacteraceae bacterium]|nr:hypothetical protein [Chthoniobacteraceae bacterium]